MVKRTFSIAEARNRFAELVHEAEAGVPIEVTRRGRPVAVVLSVSDYQRLTGTSGGFLKALATFRHGVDEGELEGLAQTFEGTRDRTSGREVSL
ncbi:MAG: type II toxin-antitoxin system Phd/YefM family antitoxin [Planctomycetota bacterium]|jgi:prevent-host-death family protein